MPQLGDEEAAARIDALLAGGGGTSVAEGGGVRRFSDEEAAARIDMLLPRELNAAEWIAGGVLGGAAKLAGLGKIATDKLNRAIGSDDQSEFFAPLERGLLDMRESVYPEASRGQGGVLEDVMVSGGEMIPTVVGGLPGRAAKALTYFAQGGVPLYYEIKAKTGDEEAATWGLFAGGAINQLEQFGAEKALGGIIKKVAGNAGLAKALAQESTKYMLGAGALTEAGTEVAQTGLSDLVYETLSGDDIANWENIKRSIPPSMILGEGFHVLDAAIQAGPRQTSQGSGGDAVLARGPGGPQDAPGAKQAAAGPSAQAKPTPAVQAAPTAAEIEEMAVPIEQAGDMAVKPPPKPGIVLPQPPTQEAPVYIPEPTAEQAPQPQLVEPQDVTSPVAQPDTVGSEPVRAEPVVAPAAETPSAALAAQPAPAAEVKAESTGQPEELTAEPQKTTGIKNAVVDRELEQMGLPPATHGDKVTDLERHGRAMATLKEDPQSGSRLVDELERSPRAPSGDEGALLALEVNRLINERDSAQEAFNADPTEANQARIDKAVKDYARAADVVTKSGTESSASLRIRKMMIARDYSLAAMERSFQAAKGGIPLTAEEQTQVRDLAAKLKASEKALEDYRKEVQPRLTELESEVAELKKGRKARRQRSVVESKKRIDEILNKLGGGQKAAAGLDLEKVKLVGELAYESVKLGYNSFALWADDVVARVGESVRPHLKQAWDDANERHDTERLGRYKSRKKGDIERVKAKGEAGVFEKPRKTPIEKDPEALKLKADYEQARRQFEGLKEKARLAHQTKGEKTLGIAKEFLDFPRAVMSSFDVSAPGRQGAFFAFGHPIMAARQAKRMFHALGSARKALEIDVALRNRPTYALGEAAGLELTRHTDDLGPTEETMRSRFAERIPGVKASNRAFTTFINLQRAHMFDRMVGALPTDKPTLEQAKAIARFVNIATGRGDPGRFGSAIDAAGHVLWSPRLLLSRFQLLAPAHLRKGDWQTRKAVAKEYARSLAGIAAIYTAVGLFDDLDGEDDVKVETDPRSSDFGKFRIGPVRIDPLAGLSQVSVLASRLASGEKKSGAGKITPIRGDDVPYGGDTSTSVVARFLRSKFGPVAATAWDAVEGEDVIGRPVELGNAPKNLLVPLSFKDVFSSLRDLGIPKTAALTLLSMFGVGVQNYDASKKDT